MTTESIIDDLQLATLDIAARRTLLIWEAERAERLDPLSRDELLHQFADMTVPNVSALFTDLTTKIQHRGDAKKMGDDEFDEAGATKSELLDSYADEIEDLAAKLVPSPAEYVADDAPLTSFDAPVDEQQAGAA